MRLEAAKLFTRFIRLSHAVAFFKILLFYNISMNTCLHRNSSAASCNSRFCLIHSKRNMAGLTVQAVPALISSETPQLLLRSHAFLENVAVWKRHPNSSTAQFQNRFQKPSTSQLQVFIAWSVGYPKPVSGNICFGNKTQLPSSMGPLTHCVVTAWIRS